MNSETRTPTYLSLIFSAALAACGSDGTPATSGNAGAPSSAGGSHSAGGSSGSGPAVAGSAGTPISSGGTATAGAPSAGASGALGSAGLANGGTAGLGSGGTSGGSAGQSGAGASGGAQGGAAGGPSDRAAASVLDHYQLLDPCQMGYQGNATPGSVCPQDTAVKNQKIALQFGGDSSVTYNVTLHVRGIMEGYWYSGGTLDPTSKTFYTDGLPTTGGFSSACKNKSSELPFMLPPEITPSDNCWNGFNMFALTVSAPKHHYYLNYTANKDSDRPPHAVYKSDYTVTIPIQGQAKLEFYIIGSDEHECYNFNQLISGLTTMPSPYIGEFVQFDVMDVSRAP